MPLHLQNALGQQLQQQSGMNMGPVNMGMGQGIMGQGGIPGAIPIESLQNPNLQGMINAELNPIGNMSKINSHPLATLGGTPQTTLAQGPGQNMPMGSAFNGMNPMSTMNSMANMYPQNQSQLGPMNPMNSMANMYPQSQSQLGQLNSVNGLANMYPQNQMNNPMNNQMNNQMNNPMINNYDPMNHNMDNSYGQQGGKNNKLQQNGNGKDFFF